MTLSSRWVVLPALTSLLSAPGFVSGDRIAASREHRTVAAPAITALTAQSIYAGVAGFRLTVAGSQFEPTAQVRWNGAQRATTFVSTTRLTATISLQDVSAAGTAQVTVVNPSTGGGTSNAMAVSIVNPVATIASLSPTTAPLLGVDFALTVVGTGFVQGAGYCTLRISLVNLGTGAIPAAAYSNANAVIRVLVGGQVIGQATLAQLDPDRVLRRVPPQFHSVTWRPGAVYTFTGARTVDVRVDPSAVIPDSNRGDNQSTESLSCAVAPIQLGPRGGP